MAEGRPCSKLCSPLAHIALFCSCLCLVSNSNLFSKYPTASLSLINFLTIPSGKLTYCISLVWNCPAKALRSNSIMLVSVVTMEQTIWRERILALLHYTPSVIRKYYLKLFVEVKILVFKNYLKKQFFHKNVS